MKTPVAFLIFNRPDTTERVFAEIARAKPVKLLVVADGPRADHHADSEKCAAARAIIERIDWECEVLTNYSEINLGCKSRVSSGLDWVFEHCEEAIILEDDCLPHPTFFRYCAELLQKYRDDERVMSISGDNFQFGRGRATYSYYFSRYPHVWGWASWRRAWKNYDVEMKVWPGLRGTLWLLDVVGDTSVAEYWRDIFDKTFSAAIDTWDYQWLFSCWTQSGLVALPSVNLVSNIGFGRNATHAKTTSAVDDVPATEMTFPLVAPPCTVRDGEADRFTEEMFGWGRSREKRLSRRLRRRLSTMMPHPVRSLISHFLAE